MNELTYSNNINSSKVKNDGNNNNFGYLNNSKNNNSGLINSSSLTAGLDGVHSQEYYRYVHINSNSRVGDRYQNYTGGRNNIASIGVGDVNKNNINNGNNVNNIKNHNIILFHGDGGHDNVTVNKSIRGDNLQTEKNERIQIGINCNQPYYISQYKDQHLIQTQSQVLPQSCAIPNSLPDPSGYISNHMGISSKNIYDIRHTNRSMNIITNVGGSNSSNVGETEMNGKNNNSSVGNNIIPNYCSNNNPNMVSSQYISQQFTKQGYNVNAFNNTCSQSQMKHKPQSQPQPQQKSHSQSYSQSYSQPYSQHYSQSYSQSQSYPYSQSYSHSHPHSQSHVQPHPQSNPQVHYQCHPQSNSSYSQPHPQSHSQMYSQSYPQSYSQQYSQSQMQVPQTQVSQKISQSQSSYYHPNIQFHPIQYHTIQPQTHSQSSQSYGSQQHQNQIYQNVYTQNSNMQPQSYSEIPVTQVISSQTFVNPVGSHSSNIFIQTEVPNTQGTKNRTKHNNLTKKNSRTTLRESEGSQIPKIKLRAKYQSKSKNGVKQKNSRMDCNIQYNNEVSVKKEVELRTDTVNLGISTFQVEVPSNISDELMNSIVRVIPREHINSILLLVSSLINRDIKINEFHGHLMSMLKGGQLVEILENILKEYFSKNNPDLLRSSSIQSARQNECNDDRNDNIDFDAANNNDWNFPPRYSPGSNRIDNNILDNCHKNSSGFSSSLIKSPNSSNSPINHSNLPTVSSAIDGVHIKSQSQNYTQNSNYGQSNSSQIYESGSGTMLLGSQLTSKRSISKHGGHYNMHTKEEVLLQMLRHSRQRCSASIMSLDINGPCTYLSKMIPNNFGVSCKIVGEENVTRKDSFHLFYKRLNEYGNYIRSIDNTLGLELSNSSKYNGINIGKIVKFWSKQNKRDNSTLDLDANSAENNLSQSKASLPDNSGEKLVFSERTVKTLYKLAGFYIKDIIKHTLEEEKLSRIRSNRFLSGNDNNCIGSNNDNNINNSIENSNFETHHSSEKVNEDEYFIGMGCDDSSTRKVQEKTETGVGITNRTFGGKNENKEINVEYDSFADNITLETDEKYSLNKIITSDDMGGRGKGLGKCLVMGSSNSSSSISSVKPIMITDLWSCIYKSLKYNMKNYNPCESNKSQELLVKSNPDNQDDHSFNV
ncbi:hypothetical protein FG379_000442 [Cryptosporidium bovis]|uniref:uncharacterized protein n=1 Tax=Cryptosporidium bovis TaxID=310047 RepID=UPI00351A9003|nr:hypothetical protein FG379_000442 [Cryptosporidium bovis]